MKYTQKEMDNVLRAWWKQVDEIDRLETAFQLLNEKYTNLQSRCASALIQIEGEPEEHNIENAIKLLK
jgi:hypothetical protein